MKKLLHILIAAVAFAVALPQTGCTTKKLDPAGVYQSDKALYDADKTITDAYDVMHTFVLFEYQNREALATKPDVRKAADSIRLNAQKWIKSAIALRDKYANAPNPENRSALLDAVRVLREAVNQASTYMKNGAK